MTTEEMLVEAKTARHQLLVGAKRVTVKYGDRTVEYNVANLPELNTYIAELEDLLGVTPETKRGQPFEVSW